MATWTPVVLEQDEAGMYIATVPTLPGCHTFGTTKDEALANIQEAILLALEEGPPRSHFLGLETVRVDS